MDFEALNRLAYFYRKFAQQDFSAKTTDALTKALKEAGLLAPEVSNHPALTSMIQEAAEGGMPDRQRFNVSFTVNNGVPNFQSNPPNQPLISAAKKHFGPLIQNYSKGVNNFAMNNWLQDIFWESE